MADWSLDVPAKRHLQVGSAVSPRKRLCEPERPVQVLLGVLAESVPRARRLPPAQRQGRLRQIGPGSPQPDVRRTDSWKFGWSHSTP